jgi:hypothetical protein
VRCASAGAEARPEGGLRADPAYVVIPGKSLKQFSWNPGGTSAMAMATGVRCDKGGAKCHTKGCTKGCTEWLSE